MMRWTLPLLAAATLWCASLARAASDPKQTGLPVQLAAAEMSAADAEILAARSGDIARSAQIYGYVLDASYSYRQVVCPGAAASILLMYDGTSAGGKVSRFSAVVPREKNGPGVDIVPVWLAGAVPFEPAWRNAHSYAVFNHMIAPGRSGDTRGDHYLGLGLCFMALVGEPDSVLRSPSLVAATIHAPEPTLCLLRDGAREEVFAVRAGAAQYQVWTLTFSPTGALVRADRETHRVEPGPATQMLAVQAEAPPIVPSESAPPVNAAVENGSGLEVSSQSEALPTRNVASSMPTAAKPAVIGPVAPPRQALPAEPPHRFIPDPPMPPRKFVPDVTPETPK